jgi:hypothetical protein
MISEQLRGGGLEERNTARATKKERRRRAAPRASTKRRNRTAPGRRSRIGSATKHCLGCSRALRPRLVVF